MNEVSVAAQTARQQHYDEKSTGYHVGSERGRRVTDLVGGPGLRVLDVACGPGHISTLMHDRNNTVVGVEISEAAAAAARKVLQEVHVFDIEQAWPSQLMNERFDAVVLGEVLEHVFDPVAVLSEARRVMTPGGRIVVTTPNFLVWIARLQILFGRFRYQRYGLFDFGHIRWFTYDYLKQVVRDAGLVIEHERHLAHPPGLAALAGKCPSVFALTFVVSLRQAPDGVP